MQQSRLGAEAQLKGVTFATLVGLAVNVALSAFKIMAGIAGNSYAVLADGFHSLSDLVTDVALLVGVRFWTAKPDESHPYGHARIEFLVSLLIALVLAGTAVGIVWGSISNYISGGAGLTGKIAVLAALASIVIKEALYRWTMTQGRKFRSSALFANAWHHRSDALSSIPAAFAAGLALVHPGLKVVDLLGAIVVAVFIVWAAWKIALPAVNALIDGSAGRETRSKIYGVAMQVPGVRDVHALRTRFLGQGVDVTMHLMVDAEISVEAGHEIAHQVEDALRALGPQISHVTIHVEPWYATVAEPETGSRADRQPRVR